MTEVSPGPAGAVQASPRVDGAIAGALLAINARYDRPLIPPTAINWLAPEIAEVVNGYYDEEHVESEAVHAAAWTMDQYEHYREALLRRLRQRLFEHLWLHDLALAAKPVYEAYVPPVYIDPATVGHADVPLGMLSGPYTDQQVRVLAAQDNGPDWLVIRLAARLRRLPS